MKKALEMSQNESKTISSLPATTPKILWFQDNKYAKLFGMLMRDRGFDMHLATQADIAITCFKSHHYDAVVFANFFTIDYEEYNSPYSTCVEMRGWEKQENKKSHTPFFAFSTYVESPIEENLARCGIDYACSIMNLDLLIALIRNQASLAEFSVHKKKIQMHERTGG